MVGYDDELSISKDLATYKVLWCGECVWVTNYIKIMEYSHENVRLKVKNNILVIQGIEMQIKMLDKKEMLLVGKINNIFLEKLYKSEV